MSPCPSSWCPLSRIPISPLSFPLPPAHSYVTSFLLPLCSYPCPYAIPSLFPCPVFSSWLPFHYFQSHIPCPVPILVFLVPLPFPNFQIPMAEPPGRGLLEHLNGAGIQWAGKAPEIPHEEGLQTQILGMKDPTCVGEMARDGAGARS